jgi:ArsR family transcriptional regulator
MAPRLKLTTQQFQRIARALSDPHRFEMLRKIHATPNMTCSDTCAELPISPATISHHLRDLETAELITVTKDGRYKLLEPRKDIWQAYLDELKAL